MYGSCTSSQLRILTILDEEHQRQTPSKRPTAPKAVSAPAPALPGASPLILAPSERQAAVEASHAQTPARPAPSKILRIFINSIDQFAQSISLCVTTNTDLADVLEQVCKKKRLNKSSYLLKIHHKGVLDLSRTVDSLGDNTDLEIVRKKFDDGFEGRTGSPGSADHSSSKASSSFFHWLSLPLIIS